MIREFPCLHREKLFRRIKENPIFAPEKKLAQ